MRNQIEHWYQEHGAALLLYGLSLTAGDRPRAQDALHQVFLQLLKSPPALADPRPYLFTALRHTLLNEQRRQARLAPALTQEPWFEERPDSLALRLALESLPAEQREVTVLHLWGGLTFAQAGEVLGISSNTAASRYRYAVEKLRTQFAPQEHPHA